MEPVSLTLNNAEHRALNTLTVNYIDIFRTIIIFSRIIWKFEHQQKQAIVGHWIISYAAIGNCIRLWHFENDLETVDVNQMAPEAMRLSTASLNSGSRLYRA